MQITSPFPYCINQCGVVIPSMGAQEAGWSKNKMRLSEALNELSASYQVEERNFHVSKPGDKPDGCCPGFYFQGGVIGQLNSVFNHLTPGKEF